MEQEIPDTLARVSILSGGALGVGLLALALAQFRRYDERTLSGGAAES